MSSLAPSNLCRLLYAQKDNHHEGMTFLRWGYDPHVVPYSWLYRKALQLLGSLEAHGLERGHLVVFQVSEEYHFVALFWACLMGGMVPVPLSVGYHERAVKKLLSVLNHLDQEVWLVGERQVFESLQPFLDRAEMAEPVHRLVFEELEVIEKQGKPQVMAGNEVAFIQFSSGSTGAPKGIILKHENLLANVEAIIEGAAMTGEDVTLSWLPLTHDMGLIGFHLVPLAVGIQQFIMTPSYFMRRPLDWLRLACEHKASLLASPNFGYHYFLAAWKKKKIELDLSRVRLILNGAEPISPTIVKTFLDALEEMGLKRSAMFPVYGLAEACLAVTFPRPGSAFKVCTLDTNQELAGQAYNDLQGGNRFVSVGRPVRHVSLRIVNESDEVLSDGSIGHIQIRGRNVTSGYYQNEEATQQAITDDGWLRTGDLGLIDKGQLVITGRVKDVLFVNGVNHYSHDMETALAERLCMKPTEVAVCGLSKDDGSHGILVFIKSRQNVDRFAKQADTIIQAMRELFRFEPQGVFPVASLPRTTSGKLQRFVLIKQYQGGHFSELEQALHALLSKTKESEVPSLEGVQKNLAELWQGLLGDIALGWDTHFFHEGGDSLKAGQLATQIEETFGIRLTLRELFTNPTLKGMSNCIEQSTSRPHFKLKHVVGETHYPLSFEERRMFFINRMDSHLMEYNLGLILEIPGRVDQKALRQAINTLSKHHRGLRTIYLTEKGTPQAIVKDEMELPLNVEVLAANKCPDFSERLVPFDLSKGPLCRFYLSQAPKQAYLFIELHHIIADGTAVGLFVDDLFQAYIGEELEASRLDFRDFAYWQRQQFDGGGFEEADSWWHKQLKDPPAPLELPTDHPRPAIRQPDAGRIEFEFPKNLLPKIYDYARDQETTLSMIMLANFGHLLSRYSHQQEFLLGLVLDGRNQPSLETMPGMLAKTLVIRQDMPETFHALCKATTENFFQVHAYQDCPFERLVEIGTNERDLSRNPLIDVMFVFQNFGTPTIELEEGAIKQRPFFNGYVNGDLALEVWETHEGLSFRLDYATSLFLEPTIKRMSQHFLNLLSNALNQPETALENLPLMSSEDRKALLNNFQDAPDIKGYLHEQIDHFANKHTTAIAIVDEGVDGPDQICTYGDLKARSDQLAAHLRQKAIKQEMVVGIFLPPSQEYAIALLGIMKAGGAWLNLAIDLPKQRLDFMIEDANVGLIVSNDRFSRVLDRNQTEILNLDALSEIENFSPPSIHQNNLAYWNYTSGSTGKPKGVMISHGAITHAVGHFVTVQGITRETRLLQNAAPSFDISLVEFFAPLTGGGQLVIPNWDYRKDSLHLLNAVANYGITHLILSPSQMRNLPKDRLNKLASLKKLVLGGEVLNQSDLVHLRDVEGLDLFNAYGPTETAVFSSIYHTEDEGHIAAVPIGQISPGEQGYLINKNLKLVPKGVAGELIIGGVGLARGYGKRPALTATAFIPDPLSEIPDARLYKTGDLVRHDHTENLVALGRLDRQLKIRGYRIETQEVENHLQEHPDVDKATIQGALIDESGAHLRAWFVGEAEVASLRGYLSERLPEYMVPSFFIKIPEMPLTPNGKVDVKALPEPDRENMTQAEYIAPETDDEKLLAAIWQDVLDLEKVGVMDHFFHIGGQSHLALKVVAALEAHHIHIGVRDLFQSPILGELAANLPEPVTGPKPLSLPHGELEIHGTKYRILKSNEKAGDILDKLPSDELRPHYIIKEGSKDLVNEADLIATVGLEERSLEKILEETRVILSRFQNTLREGLQGSSQEYDCGHQPIWFSKNKQRSALTTEIDGSCGLNLQELTNQVNHFIKAQGLLRSIFVGFDQQPDSHIFERYAFREFESLSLPTLPFLDISMTPPSQQSMVLEAVRKEMEEHLTNSSEFGTPLFLMMVIKQNHDGYQFLMSMDHIIADHESRAVVTKAFANRIHPERIDPETVTPYRKFIDLLEETYKTDIVERILNSQIYKDYRDLALQFKALYGEKPLLYSCPYHLVYERSDTDADVNPQGMALAFSVRVLLSLLHTDRICLRALVGYRHFLGHNFYNTIGDFHSSIPLVFDRNHQTAERCYSEFNRIFRNIADDGIHLSNIGRLNKEIPMVIFRSSFNFNFVGELTAESETETLRKASIFPFVKFPIFAYTRGRKVGLIFFHGLDKETETAMTEHLKELPGHYQLYELERETSPHEELEQIMAEYAARKAAKEAKKREEG